MGKFENKIHYKYIQNNSKINVIFVMFNVGSKDEVNGVPAGMSHFLEHVLFLGSQKFKTNRDIYTKVDEIGGLINGLTYQHFTGYYIKVSDSYIEEATELLADLVQNPIFDKNGIEKERNVVIEEVNAIRNKPLKNALEIFETNIFSESPISNSIGGDKNSLSKVNRANMKKYYEKYYCPANCAIIVVGRENPSMLVSKYFGEWNRKCDSDTINMGREMANCKVHKGLRIICENSESTVQDSLVIGFPLFGYNDKCKVAADLLNTIVAGMLTSRLFSRLRHQDRLVYSIQSFTKFYKDCGYLIITTSADHEHIERVLQGIFEELGRMRTEYVHNDELAKVKKNIKGVMDLRNENTYNLASFYAQNVLLGDSSNKIKSVNDYLNAVEKVNNVMIKDLASKYLTKDNCLITCVGMCSKNELEKVLRNF